MDSIQNFRARLEMLDGMLSKLKHSHGRVKQLKRSVYVLRALLKDQNNIKSPYGPQSVIVQFSVQ
ncbi:MAG: hypothetical protein KCHDKBKB_02358 [Elusimicrobia bacterium]|nr:hypothetical protein [Elusimicrobiota bacterium]